MSRKLDRGKGRREEGAPPAMLPNLKSLSLAETGMGLGRRTTNDIEREGRARIEELHEDHVEQMLKDDGRDKSTARPDELRHHWQYLFGRYRDEMSIALPPDAASNEGLSRPIRDALGRYVYGRAKKQGTILDEAPLQERAYHAEITFDSPDVYEMQAHAYHWWLLQHVAHNFHGIDHAVQQLLHSVARDAIYFKYREKTGEVVNRDHIAAQERIDAPPAPLDPKSGPFAGEPSQAAWYHYLADRVWAQSLHVGHSSYHGISLYWRVEDEVYDYLANAYPEGRREAFVGGGMQAEWLLHIKDDADRAVITPQEFFEQVLWKAVLDSARVDMSCIQARDVTNRFQQRFGTSLAQYRVKYDLPANLKQYGPSCEDTWPGWAVPKYLSDAASEDAARAVAALRKRA